MTATQKQCLLVYLGYDTGGVDGIWGDMSRQATTEFQADYGLEPDGVFGDVTLARIKAVIISDDTPPQQTQEDSTTATTAAAYLQSDGRYHIPRGVDVQLSRNLWAHEVVCQGDGCCSESIISKRMVEMFQQIRDAYGDSIEIATAGGSGYRCKTHNAAVGGAYNSLHLTGDAFDLHCRDKARLLSVVENLVTDGEIGIYSWGIHVGVWNRGYVNQFLN